MGSRRDPLSNIGPLCVADKDDDDGNSDESSTSGGIIEEEGEEGRERLKGRRMRRSIAQRKAATKRRRRMATRTERPSTDLVCVEHGEAVRFRRLRKRVADPGLVGEPRAPDSHEPQLLLLAPHCQ